MLYEARYVALRQELANARLRAGLTQFQLAECLNKAQSFVSKVETGERYLDILDFIAWCEAANSDAAEVIGRIQRVSSN